MSDPTVLDALPAHLFALSSEAEAAADKETSEQKLREELDAPDDCEVWLSFGTLRKIERVFAAVNCIRVLSTKQEGEGSAAAASPIAPKRSSVPAFSDADLTEIVERIVRDVSELPDRTSPDDAPNMMLVSGDELAAIVSDALLDAAPSDEHLRAALDDRLEPIRVEGRTVVLICKSNAAAKELYAALKHPADVAGEEQK